MFKKNNQHQIMKITPPKSYWWIPLYGPIFFLKNWSPGTCGAVSEVEICNYCIPQAGFKYEPHLQAFSCSTPYFYSFYLIPPSREIWFTIAVSILNDLVMCASYAQLALLLLSSKACLRSYTLEVEMAENMKNNCGLCWEAWTYSKALWPRILCLLSSENALA